jgi:uncharacterized protein
VISVVLDSNIYISALVFGGNPRTILELAELRVFEVYVSGPIQNEVERVLELKFLWSRARIREAAAYLWTLASPAFPRLTVADCADPVDNRVLECALETHAQVIVTGDNHLLKLHPYRGVSILKPKQFLEVKPWRS